MTIDPPRQSQPAGVDETRRLSALVDSLIVGALIRQAPPTALVAAVRYVLAVQATDACRFPCCSCPVMDCSRRPTAPR